MSADVRPELNLLHTKNVERVEDKNKTFNSKEGMRKKYMIFFDDGYKAEYCPLVGQELKIEEGNKLPFKIRFRKDFGDEIEPVQMDNIKDISEDKPKIFNMNGHPATIALSISKDIHVQKMQTKDEESLFISDMLEDADTIHEWLIKKTQTED